MRRCGTEVSRSESEHPSLASDLFDHLMIIAQLSDQRDSENDDDDCKRHCRKHRRLLQGLKSAEQQQNHSTSTGEDPPRRDYWSARFERTSR